jgi:U6 snRNA-associated Sm-like protein LSm3
MANGKLQEPLELVKLSLDELVFVKMKGERELQGRLHAFDQHMNIVLGEVEETRRCLSNGLAEGEPLIAPDPNSGEVQWKTEVRKKGMLFIRGDAIIQLSPLTKTKN